MSTTEDDLPDKPLTTGRIMLGPDGTLEGIAGGFQAIKIAQRIFQQKYCCHCAYFDKTRSDFKEKGHQNNPDDCLYHWTDVLGACWNFRYQK